MIWGFPVGSDIKGSACNAGAQFCNSVVSGSLRLHGLQQASPPCPSPTPGVYSNSRPLSWWCHPTISSSVNAFSSWLQSFPASGFFPMSWLFSSDGQSIGALASVFPTNIQSWFPSKLTGFISLQSKGLSRVFSSTPVQKHQFFGTQPSLRSNSHMHTQAIGKTIALIRRTFVSKVSHYFWICCLGLS